jgi:hypothetical protein
VSDATWEPARWAMTPPWWWKFERQSNGCLLWTGHVDKAGYGRSKGNGPAKGEVYVHRIIYKLLVGPLPKIDEQGRKLDVDHECHNRDKTCRNLGPYCLHRRCGEPSHLVRKTHTQNKADAVTMRPPRTHCRREHPLTGENVYVDPKTGQVICKACRRDAVARFRKRVVSGEKAPPPSWIAEGYRDKTRLPRR